MSIILPIGYDNFAELIENKLDFVDKSLFIKEVIDDVATKVAVITRPRRFGKTLNMSMLHHFLAQEVDGKPTKELFTGLKITQIEGGKYLEHQGKYPVIFVTFKDIKKPNFLEAVNGVRSLIKALYRNHQFLLHSEKLENNEKKLFRLFLEDNAGQTDLESSLKILSELLYKHFGQSVYILIDEYDTPIQAAHLNGYYKEMVDFIRGLFGAVLKTNPYLKRAVVTGILRVAKESIFSNLNNVEVYSILQNEYSQHFGFTQEEVNVLLSKSGLEGHAEEIKDWYNGYIFGSTVVYNPWSIAHVIKKGGQLQPYWINTSENSLIKTLLIKNSYGFEKDFEILLQGKTLERIISEHMVFADLEKNPSAAWSLLLMSGYLKPASSRLGEDGSTYCELVIPNREVYDLYRLIIKTWLSNGYGLEWYASYLQNLLSGDIPKFAQDLERIMERIVSIHDVAREPEAFYHGMFIGFLVSLDQKKYEVRSNEESGYGRYDIAIIPKDTKQRGIILELKNVALPAKDKKAKGKERLSVKLEAVLKKEAVAALEQIESKVYISELAARGVTGVVKIGIAFAGKHFRVAGVSG